MQQINVSKDNPQQSIKINDKVLIEAEVYSVTSDRVSLNSTGQEETATGTIRMQVLGVNVFSLTVSVTFTYDGQKILTHQDPPSATASAIVGYSADVTHKDIVDLSPSAKDAIADAEYKYLKIGGTNVGHIQLRFTGTGNYYVHNSYFN